MRDPRHEIVAQAIASGKAAVEASEEAGYPPGSSFAANARKRAQRLDIKARVAELQAPAEARAEMANAVSREWLLRRLHRIADLDLADAEVTVTDQIAAMRLAAQIGGHLAPTRHEVAMSHEDALDELDERPRAGATEDVAG
jgi:hypothetical protein